MGTAQVSRPKQKIALVFVGAYDLLAELLIPARGSRLRALDTWIGLSPVRCPRLARARDRLYCVFIAFRRLTLRNLGEPLNNRAFTLLLGSASCGNRPVHRATHRSSISFVVLGLSLGFARLASLVVLGTSPARGATSQSTPYGRLIEHAHRAV
jgi:hypothetical protein